MNQYTRDDVISRIRNGESLNGVDLSGIDLSNVSFEQLNLSGVNLSNANLAGTKLINTNLIGVNLNNADLLGADLRGAKLYGADLRSIRNLSEISNITDANIVGARIEDEDRSLLLSKGAQFNKRLNYSDFSGYSFMGEVDFREVEFPSDANFNGAHFYGKADFSGAKFESGVNFHMVSFDYNARFSGAEFHKEAFFVGAQFAKKDCSESAFFTRVSFHGEANFRSVDFFGNAKFEASEFSNRTNFRWAKFFKEAHFDRVIFENRVIFEGKVDKQIFKNAELVSFQYTIFEEPTKVLFIYANLEKCFFVNCDISKVDFGDVDWPKENKNNVVYYGNNEKPELVGNVYRQLKKNYENRGSYGEAGDFHYGEMEQRKLALKRDKKKFDLLLMCIYNLLSGYGENYKRAIKVLFFWLILFSCGYFFLGLEAAKNGSKGINYDWMWSKDFLFSSDFWKDCIKTFFHCLQVATYQREKSFEAFSWGSKVIELIQSIIIPIQVALMALAIKRKFKR